MNPHARLLVGLSVGWLVRRPVCPNFSKRAGRYTSMLLSMHLFLHGTLYMVIVERNIFHLYIDVNGSGTSL